MINYYIPCNCNWSQTRTHFTVSSLTSMTQYAHCKPATQIMPYDMHMHGNDLGD